MEDRKTVVISGFGPFGQHKKNASWVSINEMNVEVLNKKYNINLIRIEIPVVYKEVDKIIPVMWNNHQPTLVIHVGVSHLATELILESVACGSGYTRLDNNDCSPHCDDQLDHEHIHKLYCGLNVEKLCKMYNKQNSTLKACMSNNAGRYLCEYTYYSSLKIDPSKTLFVHVPVITEDRSAKDIAKGLETILELCLQQLKN